MRREWATKHVVVGQAVDQQQLTPQLRRVGNQVGVGVRVGVGVGHAEVSLGVVRVVQAHVGDRRARDAGAEHVGPPQQRRQGEVAPVGPAAHRHTRAIDEREALGHREQALDLVLERDVDVAAVHRLIPGDAAERRAAPVDDEHHEPLVGEPLRLEQRSLGAHDPAPVRSTVRVEQHRQRLGRLRAAGREHRHPQLLGPRRQVRRRPHDRPGSRPTRANVCSVSPFRTRRAIGSGSSTVSLTTHGEIAGGHGSVLTRPCRSPDRASRRR